MAATSNVPAAFGSTKTPSFPLHSPYHSTLNPDSLITTENENFADDQPFAFSSSPVHVATFLQPQAESVDNHEDIAAAPLPQSDLDADVDSLRERSMSGNAMLPPAGMEEMSPAASTQIAQSVRQDLESYEAEVPAHIDLQPMQAYAKLQFPDGDFYVTTFAVELGRDVDVTRHARSLKKMEDRRQVIENCEATGEIVNDGNAPSHSDRMRIREERIKEGSNVSGVGGIVGMTVHSNSEEDVRKLRRQRKHGFVADDSSQSQSIAPASLHTNSQGWGGLLSADGVIDTDAGCPLIPIHPKEGQRSTGISRKHIRIEYNENHAYWELAVQGKNGAFIDKETYLRHVGLDPEDIAQELEEDDDRKHLSPGFVIRLRHGSIIQVSSIDIVFKLPDNAREDDDVALESGESDSDVERLESSPEAVTQDNREDSGATSDLEEVTPKDRPKLKLSLSKRAQALKEQPAKATKISLKAGKGKSKGKGKGKKEEVIEDEAEPSDVRPSIEVDSSATPSNLKEEEGTPAVPAPDLPASSVLHGVAPSEMPLKRKGPGRPPKNGVMSKKDEAYVKKKQKEYTRRGEIAPPVAFLLEIVRKEGAVTAKTDGKGDGANGNGVSPPDGAGGAAGNSAKAQNAAEIEAAKARKAAKSPSPQKPESEYTEEELKKPSKTYVVQIHDAISKSTTGVMDLQQIYDAIQKMYPYYKYRSQTTGWQSSIRHNLIGSEAFKEAGKVGKGRLWCINDAFPIDKEKKQKAPTPPPNDRPAYPYYQNGQYNNNNNNSNNNTNQNYPPYRPSPYGTPYGPPTTAANGVRAPPSYATQRAGTYHSPYASNPSAPAPSPYGAQPRPPYAHAHAPNPVAGQTPPAGTAPSTSSKPAAAPHGHPQPPPNGQTAQSAPGPAQQGPQDDTIEEIMAYHKRFLSHYKPGADQDAARNLFRKAVSRHIDHHKEHGDFENDEERTVTKVLGEIIARNKGKKGFSGNAPPTGTPGTSVTADTPTPPAGFNGTPQPALAGIAQSASPAASHAPNGAPITQAPPATIDLTAPSVQDKMGSASAAGSQPPSAEVKMTVTANSATSSSVAGTKRAAEDAEDAAEVKKLKT